MNFTIPIKPKLNEELSSTSSSSSDSDDEYLTSDSEAPEYLLAPKAKKRRYVLEL